ncbi:KEOPS complex kinase/ATPase Bud32 [Nanoarchaeota archaeon]
MEQISQGAEAKIFQDGEKIVKDRFSKGYRHPILDEKLRKFRTRREAKVMDKVDSLGFPGPKLLEFCDKDMKIEMDFLEGPKIRDVFEDNHQEFSEKIGKQIALLHDKGIIHGDLTTSNMILANNQINFIDFGLSFFSEKDEDKAVDLHLLKQALESKHFTVFENAFDNVIKGYSEFYPESKEVLERLEKVEKRGRYKHR